MKIVVGASSFGDTSDEVVKMITDKGIELVKNPFGRRLTLEETIEHLQGADGILAGLEPLNDEVFSKCPDLKAVSRIGIGMDNVDIEAANKHGIKVSNTPEGPSSAVAEMTLAALLSICHQIVPSNKDIHDGVWKKRMGKSITELTILIVGYGHIGKKVADIFSRLGAKVLIYDKYQSGVSTCELDEGLKQADVVSVHASGKDEILNSTDIRKMKEGVIILNSARGGLISEDAVFEGLQSGHISYFWGDALWQEPYGGKVASCENAILTPHICTYTSACRQEMEKQAVNNILRDLDMV